MTIPIKYDKNKVIQALRYHFISRSEIKILMILVNVFAILSAALFFYKVIQPISFLVSSFLWFSLMVVFWFILPRMVYRRTATFKEQFELELRNERILIHTDRGTAEWEYKKFAYFIESPHFFHLYINDKSFFIVPKDGCTGEADTMEVRKLLTDKIGRKK